MATAEVHPVTSDMFEHVWPLLEGFDTTKMSKTDWRRMLFEHGWKNDDDPYGYVLVKGEEPVGFVGTIFSTQRVAGEERRFCNFSSWIVKPEYRMLALSLLKPVLDERSHTVTCLTPISATTKILRRFGFQELEREALVMSPASSVTSARSLRRFSWTCEPDEIEAALEGRDREVFLHHKDALCGHLLLEWSDGYCYVLTTRWSLKQQAVSYVRYVSDRERFWSHLGSVQWALFRANGTLFTMIDKREAGRERAPLGIRYPFRQPPLYRPPRDAELPPTEVSALYSELMWLRV